MKILMVCLGNICRSPLADGLLRHKAKKESLDIEVDSAGTSGYHAGQAPDSRMIKTAKSKGIDISILKSRQFELSDFESFDLIYVMDNSNHLNITQLAKNSDELKKVRFLLNEINPNKNENVPDPYYDEDEGFERVFNLVDKATDIIIEKYKKKNYYETRNFNRWCKHAWFRGNTSYNSKRSC